MILKYCLVKCGAIFCMKGITSTCKLFNSYWNATKEWRGLQLVCVIRVF